MADSFELQIVNPVESRELRVEWLRARCNVYTSNRTILEINVAGASTGLNRDTVDLSLVSPWLLPFSRGLVLLLVDDN